MLSGKVILVAVTAWIRHAGQRDLGMADARHRGKDGLLTASSPNTVTRVLGLAGPQPLSGAVGSFLSAAVPAWPAEERQEEEEERQREELPVRPHPQCDGKALEVEIAQPIGT
jgi:hypothetical protein